jgi:hypothetical protein
MEIKEIEVDSSYRNRNQYPNPFEFDVAVNTPPKIKCRDAVDPVSSAAPQYTFTGNTLTPTLPNIASISGTVVRVVTDTVEVQFINVLFSDMDYYRGLTTSLNETILHYENVDTFLGRFRLQPFNISTYFVGSIFTLQYWPITQLLTVLNSIVRLFIPAKPLCNEVKLVYNETRNNWNEIVQTDEISVHILVRETDWMYSDTFSLRDTPPSWVGTVLLNTANSITVNAIDPNAQQDIVFIPSINYYGKLVLKSGNVFTVTPSITTIIVPGSAIQCLRFTYDNSRSLQYIGTADQQQRTWIVKLVSVQIPNIRLKNKENLFKFSHLYLEFRDTISPQYNIMSNNPNSNNSYFRIIPSKMQTQREWISFDCDGSQKTVRFSPTSTEFKFRILSPEGQILEFLTEDNKWPKKSKSRLQINALFNVCPFNT